MRFLLNLSVTVHLLFPAAICFEKDVYSEIIENSFKVFIRISLTIYFRDHINNPQKVLKMGEKNYSELGMRMAE